MMKLKEIADRLRKENYSATTVNRMVRMAEEFATPEAFFGAEKGRLFAVYNKLMPNGKRGLGKNFFTVFNRALAMTKEPCETPAAPTAQKPTNETALLGCSLTLADVAKVKDFMEMFGVKEMTFGKIATLLNLCGADEKKEGEV